MTHTHTHLHLNLKAENTQRALTTAQYDILAWSVNYSKKKKKKINEANLAKPSALKDRLRRRKKSSAEFGSHCFASPCCPCRYCHRRTLLWEPPRTPFAPAKDRHQGAPRRTPSRGGRLRDANKGGCSWRRPSRARRGSARSREAAPHAAPSRALQGPGTPARVADLVYGPQTSEDGVSGPNSGEAEAGRRGER